MTQRIHARRKRVRLNRDATIGVVLATTLACGALGVVGAAAVSRSAAASSPRFAEARFLPLVGPQVPAQDTEPDVEASPYDDISLGSSTTAGPSDIILDGGAVVVPLASGWSEADGDGQRWTLLTDNGSVWIWVRTATTDATLVTSDALLRASFEHTFVADARVDEVAASNVEALPPFGKVTSRSMLSYRGLYADSAFTSRFESNLYAGVRNDGTVLLVEVRVYPGHSWDVAADSWYPVMYQPLWESFSDAALPTVDSPP